MAVIVFVIDGRVVWPLAFSMMASSIVGGYLGARWGRKLDQKFIRAFVIAVGFGLAGYYFWHQVSVRPAPAEATGDTSRGP